MTETNCTTMRAPVLLESGYGIKSPVSFRYERATDTHDVMVWNDGTIATNDGAEPLTRAEFEAWKADLPAERMRRAAPALVDALKDLTEYSYSDGLGKSLEYCIRNARAALSLAGVE